MLIKDEDTERMIVHELYEFDGLGFEFSRYYEGSTLVGVGFEQVDGVVEVEDISDGLIGRAIEEPELQLTEEFELVVERISSDSG